MKYLSTFSGIEAATVAWHPLGWEPVGFSEIEPFPCAVLNHHYPNTPNYGDITKFREWSVEPFQLLVGGSPCQSFSVAGLRKGLADERGNLMLEFGRLAQHYRPTWVVWENVPGVLSSNGGRDFASFLGMLAEFGYGFAYRILDAQYFGVPQRRRRVFVVGYLGDWRPAAAVLFDPHSLSGHPPPSREKREGTAGGVEESIGGYCQELSNALCARDYKGPRPEADQGGPVVVQPTWWDGSDIAATLTKSKANGAQRMPDKDNFGAVLQPVTCDMAQVTAPVNKQNRKPGDPCHTLAKENAGHAAVVQPMAIQGNLIGRDAGGPQGIGVNAEGTMYTLTKADVHGVVQPIGFDPSHYTRNFGQVGLYDKASTLKKEYNDQSTHVLLPSMAVRRLTPKECERLQGFPDGYTAIPWKNKPADQCPDGPRYKALGNSMAVPVMRWIGERIQAVEELMKEI